MAIEVGAWGLIYSVYLTTSEFLEMNARDPKIVDMMRSEANSQNLILRPPP